MIQRCPGCGRENQRDVGLRSGVKLVLCGDCQDAGLTPDDFTDDGEPLAQCEACDERHPESELNYRDVPGATLAFCDDCTEQPRHVQYGVRR